MKICLNIIGVLFLILSWVGLVVPKLEIYISRYQFDNFKNMINKLSLDPNTFSRNKKIKNVIADRMIDISSRYSALLDSILSFENWIKRFSKEYHENTFKNKKILALIISINSEFDVIKLKFNKFSNDIDTFIESMFSKSSSTCISSEKFSKGKYKKTLENLYRQLFILNQDIKRLVGYQHKMINSSSLYIVKLDERTDQTKTTQVQDIVDISNENSLYDLWIYYEHHRLPNLKEKLVFISRSISILIYQNKIILEFLLYRYKVLTEQYLEFFNSSNHTKSVNLRASSHESSLSKYLDEHETDLEASIQQQRQFFKKCLDAEESGLMTPLDSVGNIGDDSFNTELFNVNHMVEFMIRELETKCTEFQRNNEILSEFNTFIANELKVNTTNINDFFFSGDSQTKKNVFSQLTYQVNQLNTISEFVNTLEQSLKAYHYFNIPCYYGIVNYYLKQSFNTFFNIYYEIENNLMQKTDITATLEPNIGALEPKYNNSDSELNKVNITVTDEMIKFMFNCSEIANSEKSCKEFKNFPHFNTKYNFATFTNIRNLPPDLNLGELNENLETLMDRFLKGIIVHEKKLNDDE
ncbi:hypothetical protein [Cryptosporidium parvum Iowa II]|uniref:Uncharacterized protein n=2 Tax=Cryptosporidium parvum TaxID=5807 RepID=Q5CQR5_CRYPI|nr:hypothetical protein [Cryptosporidium parvum Iowa II]EAK87766.1 hypothetical protein with signal peptide [Cryptosporidium parvum Iowa II]QOY42075.1 Uncharacterized protein CPATCC_0018980 [Cryptosporidium parvum]WRK31951.1 Uncharacterized protein cpbgf_4003610 [Cryptosporidium parvum]|eukprot:QOY42075.1 hypothetical protein CPATCC_001676 [Cryptosporidium parvum]